MSLGKVQATGSLLGEADLTCETGDIDNVLISERIYGTITANNGQGSLKNIRYTDRTFRNPDTEQVDLPLNHINAEWTAPKTNSSVQFTGGLTPRLLRSLRECFPMYV